MIIRVIMSRQKSCGYTVPSGEPTREDMLNFSRNKIFCNAMNKVD